MGARSPSSVSRTDTRFEKEDGVVIGLRKLWFTRVETHRRGRHPVARFDLGPAVRAAGRSTQPVAAAAAAHLVAAAGPA